jgi:hypothetical protein
MQIGFSIMSCPSIIIVENTLNECRKNVVMVSLTTGMFLLIALPLLVDVQQKV